MDSEWNGFPANKNKEATTVPVKNDKDFSWIQQFENGTAGGQGLGGKRKASFFSPVCEHFHISFWILSAGVMLLFPRTVLTSRLH